MIFSHLYIIFGETPLKFFLFPWSSLPIFEWVIWFFYGWVVGIFLIYSGHYPLIRYIFCKLFSHYLSCLFTLLILSFDRQNCLSLIESHLSIFFFFLACSFCVISKKSLPSSISWKFPHFLLRLLQF